MREALTFAFLIFNFYIVAGEHGHAVCVADKERGNLAFPVGVENSVSDYVAFCRNLCHFSAGGNLCAFHHAVFVFNVEPRCDFVHCSQGVRLHKFKLNRAAVKLLYALYGGS